MSNKFRRNILKIKNDFALGKNLVKLPKIKSRKSFALKNELIKFQSNTEIESSSQPINSYKEHELNFQSVKRDKIISIKEENEENKWIKNKNGVKKDFNEEFQNTENKKIKSSKLIKTKKSSKKNQKNFTKKKVKVDDKLKKNSKISKNIQIKEFELKKKATKQIKSKKIKEKVSELKKKKPEMINSLQNTKEVILKRNEKTVNKKKKKDQSVALRNSLIEKESEEFIEMQKTIKSKDSQHKDTIFCVIKGYKDSYFVNGKELNGINELIDYIKSKKSLKLM